MNRPAAALSLIAAMALTGANVPIGKAIVDEIPIYVLIAFRFAIASAALALLVSHEAGPRLREMTGRQFGSLLVMSVVGSVLFTAFLLEGTKRTAAVDAGIITATLPAAVAVLGLIFLGRRLTLRQISLVGLAVLGLTVVQTGQAGHGLSSSLGNSLVGVAVLCEASFVIVSQRMSAAFGPIRLSLGVSLLSLLASLPLAALEAASFDINAVSTDTWLLALWYAISASVLCTILWYRGAAHVEPWMAGLATAALPVSALLVAAIGLGESVSLAQLTGAVLVIAAIIIGALWPSRSFPRF